MSSNEVNMRRDNETREKTGNVEKGITGLFHSEGKVGRKTMLMDRWNCVLNKWKRECESNLIPISSPKSDRRRKRKRC